jgi:hypothetical protein
LRLSGANTAYKAAALPLSYAPEMGIRFRVTGVRFRSGRAFYFVLGTLFSQPGSVRHGSESKAQSTKHKAQSTKHETFG